MKEVPKIEASSCFPFLAVTAGKLPTAGRPGWGLFWMQIRGSFSRDITFDPIEISRAARQTTGDDVTRHRCCFRDSGVGFRRDGDETIRRIAAHRPGRSKMKWHRDLMDGLAVQLHRLNSSAN